MISLFVITLPVLILLCGLSIDLTMIELQQQRMQTAADSAAISAELEAERGTTAWATLGQQDAAQNGFTDGVNGTTVSVVEGATYGAYSGRNDGLQVTITQPVKTVFMGALSGHWTASARSVAQITPCIYLAGTGTLNTTGGSVSATPLDTVTGSIDGDSCPVYANAGIDVESSGHVAVEAINVAGSAAASTQAGFVYPSPVFNAPAMSDPLAAVTKPTVGSCTMTSYSITTGSATLSPGTYCKGMSISNATVTLNPGLYVITGGATWNNATVTGTGVTLFFTTGGGATTYGQIKVSYSTVNLSAPADSSNGGIPAIAVYADRNWVPTGAQDFQLNTDTWSGDGIWYLTHAGMWVWSCTNLSGSHYFGIYADNLRTGGTIITPLNDYSYVSTGNPFRTKAPLVQ